MLNKVLISLIRCVITANVDGFIQLIALSDVIFLLVHVGFDIYYSFRRVDLSSE